jgi:hypothetical protein
MRNKIAQFYSDHHVVTVGIGMFITGILVGIILQTFANTPAQAVGVCDNCHTKIRVGQRVSVGGTPPMLFCEACLVKLRLAPYESQRRLNHVVFGASVGRAWFFLTRSLVCGRFPAGILIIAF